MAKYFPGMYLGRLGNNTIKEFYVLRYNAHAVLGNSTDVSEELFILIFRVE
jgi:hypothetical protein